MNKIVLEINGVRHRLVYDPTQTDCRDCSLQGKEHCNGNLCIQLIRDIRYHFIKEDVDNHTIQMPRAKVNDLIVELLSKGHNGYKLVNLNLVVEDNIGNSVTYTLDRDNTIEQL